MKIIYNKNPLKSIVELDLHEKKLFWHLIKIDELKEELFSVNYYLKQEEPKIKEALLHADDNYLCKKTDKNKSELNERVDELYNSYISDLADRHYGDCVCQPVSCGKCCAESILGIDTIPILKKHSAYKIDSIFDKNENISYDEAIERLNNYKPTATWNGWEIHIPRWTQEAKDAAEWLESYKEKYKLGFEYLEIIPKGD